MPAGSGEDVWRRRLLVCAEDLADVLQLFGSQRSLGYMDWGVGVVFLLDV